MLDGATLMPVLIQFNAAADNDQQFLQFIKLPKGSFLTFDKGYNSYQQFAAFTSAEIFFITRQKDNAVYKSVSEKILTAQMPDAVLKEEIIEFSNIVAILRMHLPSYISIKNLLALHNKKRLRYKKAELQQDLFTNF